MSIILALFFLTIFIFLSWRNLVWGAGIIIVLLPSYLWRLEIFPLPTTFLELMIVSLFLVFLFKDQRYQRINFSLAKNQNNLLPSVPRFLLLAWILASALALLVNPTYGSLGLWRAYFLEPLMFFIVLLYSVKDKKDLKIIINSLTLLIIWLFGLALYQNFSQWNYLPAYNFPNPKRITAIFSYPNALSLLTAPLAGFFAIFWLYQKKQRYNWVYILIAFLALFLAFLALSQGAILAIVASLFFYLILAKKVRKWGRPLVILTLILAFIFGNIGYYLQKSWQEFKNPEINLSASSLEIRSDQWQETRAMLKDNFIFGAGLDGYQQAMRPYHQTSWLEIYLYPHNIFLNFWTELGLFGLMVFLALMFYISFTLIFLFKEKNNLAWPLTLTWLIYFVHGLVDVPYFKNDLSVLFFLLLFLTIWAKENKGQTDIYQD